MKIFLDSHRQGGKSQPYHHSHIISIDYTVKTITYCYSVLCRCQAKLCTIFNNDRYI